MYKIIILENGKEQVLERNFATYEEAEIHGESVGFEAFKIVPINIVIGDIIK